MAYILWRMFVLEFEDPIGHYLETRTICGTPHISSAVRDHPYLSLCSPHLQEDKVRLRIMHFQ